MSEATKTCIMCGADTAGSMDGPYICGPCDSGIRPDCGKFTVDDAHAYYNRVADWRAAAERGDPDHRFAPIFSPSRKAPS